MEKLIVSAPAFNTNVIKIGMFIQYKSSGIIHNGIITSVGDKKIQYLTGLTNKKVVDVAEIVEGVVTIKVADNIEHDPVTNIVKGASTKILKGYSGLHISLQRNQHTDGILFDGVFVDGVPYVQKFK